MSAESENEQSQRPSHLPPSPSSASKWVWLLVASVSHEAVVQIGIQGRQDGI